MAIASSPDYDQVLMQVRSWPPEMRINLAQDLLRSLQAEFHIREPRGVPSERVRGMAAGEGSPPDDETVRRWLDERRQEKLG
jgi:hypothetical protein